MGPLSSCSLMYLSLHIKNPDLVSLNTCLTQQMGQITWQAATFWCRSVMLAFWICFTMQVSQRQSPQNSTLGMLPLFVAEGWQYSELQSTQLRKSPWIKKFSKFLKLPPILPWDIGSMLSQSLEKLGWVPTCGMLKNPDVCTNLASVCSSSNSCSKADSCRKSVFYKSLVLIFCKSICAL